MSMNIMFTLISERFTNNLGDIVTKAVTLFSDQPKGLRNPPCKCSEIFFKFES